MIVRITGDRRRFVILDAMALEDPNLSLDAIGLYCYLMTKVASWEIRTSEIRRRFGIGRDKVRRIFSELEQAGYAELVPMRGHDGRVIGTEWVLYETPSLKGSLTSREADLPSLGEGNRETGLPTVGFTDGRETRPLNNNGLEEISIELRNKEGELAPAAFNLISPYGEDFLDKIQKHAGGSTYIRLKGEAKKRGFPLEEAIERYRLWLCEKVALYDATGEGFALQSLTRSFVTIRLQRWILQEYKFMGKGEKAASQQPAGPPTPSKRRYI